MMDTIIRFIFRDVIKPLRVSLHVNTLLEKSVVVTFKMLESENMFWGYL